MLHSSSMQLHSMWPTRQLLHLDSADAIDSADAAEGGLSAMMYPREPQPVQRYLTDALRSNTPLEVPVWFVIVTDPG